jgi:hypothetical protein
MKMAVFWVVAQCSLVEVFQRFRGACCLHHQGDEPLLISLMMEAASTYETLVNFYQTTQCYNPEASHLHLCSSKTCHNLFLFCQPAFHYFLRCVRYGNLQMMYWKGFGRKQSLPTLRSYPSVAWNN